MGRKLAPDGLCDVVEPLILAQRERPQGGGTRHVDDRAMLTAISYVLTTGCAWRHMPAEFGLSNVVGHSTAGKFEPARLLSALPTGLRRGRGYTPRGQRHFSSGRADVRLCPVLDERLRVSENRARVLQCVTSAAGRPARTCIHDLTQIRQTGLVELLTLVPGATLLADAGYQGLSAQTAGAVLTPRPARRKNQLPVLLALAAAHEAERRAPAVQRIRVGHGISHLKNWRALSGHLGRREHLDAMLRAVAGLVSGQERAPRPDLLRRPPRALTAGTTG